VDESATGSVNFLVRKCRGYRTGAV